MIGWVHYAQQFSIFDPIFIYIFDEFGRKFKFFDVWEKFFIIVTAGYG